ncbi:MAG TPA: hypothetical protein PKZ84_11655 [Anaerolineae bacterium]|nr:hypothetical protein [Anaerolineae bacterium]
MNECWLQIQSYLEGQYEWFIHKGDTYFIEAHQRVLSVTKNPETGSRPGALKSVWYPTNPWD